MKKRLSKSSIESACGVILVVIAVILIVGSIVDMSWDIYYVQYNKAKEEIRLDTENQARNFEIIFGEIKTRVEDLAFFVEQQDDIFGDKIKEVLGNLTVKTMVAAGYVGSADGKFCGADGRIRKIESEKEYEMYFGKDKEKTRLLPIYIPDGLDIPVISIAAPIYKDGKFIGEVCIIYTVEDVSKLLQNTDNESDNNTYIFTKKGDFIARPIEDEIIDTQMNIYEVRNVTLLDTDMQKEIEAVQNDKSGYIKYELKTDGRRRTAYYMPAGFEDTYILKTFPMSRITKDATSEIKSKFSFVLKIGIAALLLILVTMREQHKKLNETSKAKQKVEKIEETLKVALSHSTSLVMEYNYADRSIGIVNTIFETKDMKFYEAIINPELSQDFIYVGDRGRHEKLCTAIKGGRKSETCEIRLKIDPTATEYKWYELTMTNIFDEKKELVRAIITLQNVDNRKILELTLKNRIK